MINSTRNRTDINKAYLELFEEHVKTLFLNKLVKGPIHLSGGNEEQLIDIFKHIKDEDWVFSTHRNHYHYLLKGGNPDKLMSLIKEGNSMHVFDSYLNFFSSAIVGGCLPIATGVALSLKKNNKKGQVWCFCGDGATDSGRFYEAIRYSRNEDLPITFVVEDNGMSCDSPLYQRCNSYVIDDIDRYSNVIIYYYNRIYPHTGCGEWVEF